MSSHFFPGQIRVFPAWIRAVRVVDLHDHFRSFCYSCSLVYLENLGRKVDARHPLSFPSLLPYLFFFSFLNPSHVAYIFTIVGIHFPTLLPLTFSAPVVLKIFFCLVKKESKSSISTLNILSRLGTCFSMCYFP